MKKIYKYALGAKSDQVINLPVGAQILCVQVQHGSPHLWAMVDPSCCLHPVRIRMIGTGHEIHDDEKLRYVDTYQLHEGGYVFHVFRKVL